VLGLKQRGKKNSLDAQACHAIKKRRSLHRRLPSFRTNYDINSSVPIRIIKDSTWLGKPLPRLAMTLWAHLRGQNHILRLKTTRAALYLKYGYPMRGTGEWVERGKMTVRFEAIH
jgi:hypothetical protein